MAQLAALDVEPSTPGAWHRALRAFFSRPLAVTGLVLLVALIVLALSAGILFPGDPLDMVAQPLLPPGADPHYLLGTDQLGRNVIAEIAYGSRVSLSIGAISALVSLLVGVPVGAIAGYFGGWVDDVLVHLTELFQVTPSLLFVIVILAIGSPSATLISVSIGLTSWPVVARLVRAEFRALVHSEFVQAARALGYGDTRIILMEILPNALPPIVVTTSVIVATAILMESALAFLGLGDPNHVSWGSMIGDARAMIRTAPYLSAEPGCALVLAVLSLNLVGEGLNEALNPRLRES